MRKENFPERNENDEYVVVGTLRMSGKDYYFCNRNWFDFVCQINEMMREYKITYEVGEDDNMVEVTKMVKEVPKFR